MLAALWLVGVDLEGEGRAMAKPRSLCGATPPRGARKL